MLAQREMHVNEEVFALIIAIKSKIQRRRRIKVHVTCTMKRLQRRKGRT